MPHRNIGRRIGHDGGNVIVVVSGRHPWEISGLCIFVIVGLALVAGNPAPNSVNAALPGGLVLLWKAMLALGAALALVAVSLPQNTVPRLETSMVVELAAMVWFGSATLVFPVVLAATGQRTALTVIGYATVYGMGGLWRAWQITTGLRRIQTATQAPDAQ